MCLASHATPLISYTLSLFYGFPKVADKEKSRNRDTERERESSYAIYQEWVKDINGTVKQVKAWQAVRLLGISMFRLCWLLLLAFPVSWGIYWTSPQHHLSAAHLFSSGATVKVLQLHLHLQLHLSLSLLYAKGLTPAGFRYPPLFKSRPLIAALAAVSAGCICWTTPCRGVPAQHI